MAVGPGLICVLPAVVAQSCCWRFVQYVPCPLLTLWPVVPTHMPFAPPCRRPRPRAEGVSCARICKTGLDESRSEASLAAWRRTFPYDYSGSYSDCQELRQGQDRPQGIHRPVWQLVQRHLRERHGRLLWRVVGGGVPGLLRQLLHNRCACADSAVRDEVPSGTASASAYTQPLLTRILASRCAACPRLLDAGCNPCTGFGC